MSQRMPNNMNNNTNVGTINYDVYNPRLRKAKITVPPSRPAPVRNLKDTTSSKSKLTMHNNPVNPMVRNRGNINQLKPCTPLSPSNTVRKDVYPNNAPLVEVMVKTTKNPQAVQNKLNNQNEPWAKLLKPQPNIEDGRSFNNFDPLRTVHFLSKELQLKLIQKMPSKNV